MLLFHKWRFLDYDCLIMIGLGAKMPGKAVVILPPLSVSTEILVVGSPFLSKPTVLFTLTVRCVSREPGIGVPGSVDISRKWERISGMGMVNLPQSGCRGIL
jgi:hypothetical protein